MKRTTLSSRVEDNLSSSKRSNEALPKRLSVAIIERGQSMLPCIFQIFFEKADGRNEKRFVRLNSRRQSKLVVIIESIYCPSSQLARMRWFSLGSCDFKQLSAS